jgi:hypothetical protein
MAIWVRTHPISPTNKGHNEAIATVSAAASRLAETP